MDLIGIDYGRKWIGLAWGSDTLQIAVPLPAIRVHSFSQVVQSLQQLLRERNVSRLIIGLPINMDGTEGSRAQEVRSFAQQLQAHVPVSITFQDERLSTQTARTFIGADRQPLAQAKAQKNRGILDSTAAVVILEDWLAKLPFSSLSPETSFP